MTNIILTNQRSETQMVETCVAKDSGRCSKDDMEDGRKWTSKERKTETVLERCYTRT